MHALRGRYVLKSIRLDPCFRGQKPLGVSVAVKAVGMCPGQVRGGETSAGEPVLVRR